jgi:hypothetical protein
MTRKNFKKSSQSRTKETRRHIAKYSPQNNVPGESTIRYGSGFREQVNLYWQKRNAEKKRYKEQWLKQNI